MPFRAPGCEGGRLALLVLLGVVGRKETAKNRDAEFCLVLSQLMTVSPTVTVLNVSIIPYITWPPCSGRFSQSPHLTSFNCRMNGHFSVELITFPAHWVLEVTGDKLPKGKDACLLVPARWGP